MANPFFPPDGIRQALSIAARDENIDLQILIQLLYHYKSLSGLAGVQSVKAIAPVDAIVGAAADVAMNTGKPMVMVLPNMKKDTGSLEVEDLIRETRQALVDKGIPVYDDLRNAMCAIGRVSGYYAVRERRAGKSPVRSAGA
jgi:hypothetical protein